MQVHFTHNHQSDPLTQPMELHYKLYAHYISSLIKSTGEKN